MNDLISLSNARATFPDLVSRVSTTMDRVTITVHGQPKAILISAEELESLEETAEILAIPHIKEDIAESRAQIKRGEFIALADLK